MSYGASKHAVLSNRIKASINSLHDTINREMETIDDIYINEAEGGTHAAFVANENATKQEHIDAIVAIRAFQATLSAQMPNITPWLQ